MTAGEALTLGDALAVNNTNGRVVKADANGATANLTNVIGFATESVADTDPVKVASLHGQIVTVVNDISGTTIGDVAYLSETAGQVTTTAPTASGSTIYRAGIVYDKGTGAGSGRILFIPQFISDIP